MDIGASSTKAPGPGAGARVSLAWWQGQGWGKGSGALRVLPQLGDDQFLLEEEKAPLAPPVAPGQPHVCAQHRLGVGESLPAEQRAAGMRKAAAARPGRAHPSLSRRGDPTWSASSSWPGPSCPGQEDPRSAPLWDAAQPVTARTGSGVPVPGSAVRPKPASCQRCSVPAQPPAAGSGGCWLQNGRRWEANGKWAGPRAGGALQRGPGCLALGSPEQDRAEGKHPLPPPAASGLPAAARDALSPRCPRGTLLAPSCSTSGPP